MTRTQDLVATLSSELQPVRRIPPIRVGLTGVLVAWSIVFVALSWLHEPSVPLSDRLAANGAWAGVLFGLALCALCATIAALAGAVPGREELERRARWLGVGGLAMAALVAGYATWAAWDAESATWRLDATCFTVASVVGLVPAAGLIAYLRRGFVLRPDRDAALLLLGAFGLGATAVHFICHHAGARHALLGHTLVPFVLTSALVLPLRGIVSRWRP